jgi:putative hemolysin
MHGKQTVWNRRTHKQSRTSPLAVLVATLMVIAACATTDTPQATMPNPAAAYCEEQGYLYEIRSAADGSQSGVCRFPDGSECEGWAFYRGECKPGAQATATPEVN